MNRIHLCKESDTRRKERHIHSGYTVDRQSDTMAGFHDTRFQVNSHKVDRIGARRYWHEPVRQEVSRVTKTDILTSAMCITISGQVTPYGVIDLDWLYWPVALWQQDIICTNVDLAPIGFTGSYLVLHVMHRKLTYSCYKTSIVLTMCIYFNLKHLCTHGA